MKPIRFTTFPRTAPPPPFVESVVQVFRAHDADINTSRLKHDSLSSDGVLQVLRGDLEEVGFQVESGKKKGQKIHRPVFFGENGVAEVRYEIDAFHSRHQCGLEVEAGRAWMGNAVYRDLILAGVMVDVDHLILAVGNEYWYTSGGKPFVNRDYEYARGLADTLYSHRRMVLPYKLTVLGY
jgi:hypothetical protein